MDQETSLMLLQKRAKVAGGKPLTEAYLKENAKMSMKELVDAFFAQQKNLKDVPGVKPYFRLTPPVKGFERGGIKKPFSMGGVLGYRKEKINALIQRMM